MLLHARAALDIGVGLNAPVPVIVRKACVRELRRHGLIRVLARNLSEAVLLLVPRGRPTNTRALLQAIRLEFRHGSRVVADQILLVVHPQVFGLADAHPRLPVRRLKLGRTLDCDRHLGIRVAHDKVIEADVAALGLRVRAVKVDADLVDFMIEQIEVGRNRRPRILRRLVPLADQARLIDRGWHLERVVGESHADRVFRRVVERLGSCMHEPPMEQLAADTWLGRSRR